MTNWKVINGFSNYQVSDEGEVFSVPRPKTRGGLIKQRQGRNGRFVVDLWDDNHNKKGLWVHQLVASHFLPNIYGKKQVDHRNGDYTDNRAINLRWASSRENILNTRKRVDNTSGYKGVCFDKSRCRWVARVSKEGGGELSKRFKTKAEAISFRDQLVKIHYNPSFYTDDRW